jgi:lipopolysaccharide/colanic/teichoic acid biosynthesis glycosyltransferase
MPPFVSGLGVFFALAVPVLLVMNGLGMSRQDETVALQTAALAFLAISSSLLICHRLLAIPLLRTATYVTATFVTSFLLVAAGAKLFRVGFSSPQFFASVPITAGFVEGFLAINRRRRPWRIAIVPGGMAPAEPPQWPYRPIEKVFLSGVPIGDVDFSGVTADLSFDHAPQWERFLAATALDGIPVYHVKQFNELITGRVTLDHLRENTLGGIMPTLVYPQVKRAWDLLLSFALLPFIVPVLAIAAVLIKLDTRGPVFYREQRIGLGGRPFTIYKLRTMEARPNGHAQLAYTLENDPRITRAGRVLRRYRIDELPQVINILRGEMSWIGPRPEALSLAERYERAIAFYAYRHIVPPGISGWAQVNQGNVGAEDAARVKLEYDFFYIKHLSLWLDAVIFVKTLRTLITGSGAR